MQASLFGLIAVLIVFAEQPAGFKFGPNLSFRLELSQDSFGVRSHGILEGAKFYPLPQSTLEGYIRLRPADIKLNPISATANRYDRQEVIGPYQIESNRLWFGNNFYDGEGDRGVGAFGYFDTNTRRYHLYSPPEVAPYEVTALLVERDRIWLGLDHFGKDASKSPGGLIEWNRSTHAIRHYDTEFVITDIGPPGGGIMVIGTMLGANHDGTALLHDGRIERWIPECKGCDRGKPVDRFPATPTYN